MIFSEYLVRKNLIQKSDFLSVLLEQVRQTPSVLEILLELNLLDQDKIFDVYCFQIEHNISSIEALKSLNFWSQELEKKIHETINDKIPSLSYLLISKNKISYDNLFTHLDDFSHDENIQKKSQKTEQTPQENKENKKETTIFPTLDKIMIKNLIQTLEESFLSKIKNLDKFNKDDFLKSNQDCLMSAKFVRSSLIENLLRSIHDCLSKHEINDNIKSVLNDVSSQIGFLIISLQESSSEEEFWKRNQNEYIELLKKIREIS